MPVVEFSGGGNYVRVRPAPGGNLGSGDLTVVCLIRKLTGADGAIDPVIECYDGSTGYWSWTYTTGNQSVFSSAGSDSYGGEAFASFLESDGWAMCSIRKATGTNKPRHQRWRLSDGNTGTEDHPGAALADSTVPGTSTPIYTIGELLQFTLGSKIRLAWLALFDGYLSDAQIAECHATRRTSNAWDNSFGVPVVLLEADGSGLVDVAGTTVSVTTTGSVPVITGDDPPDWIMNGVGGPAAPIAAGAPVIVGVAQTGRAISVTNGSWDPDPDNAPDSYAYQWERDSGSGFVAIGGETSSSYTLANDDAGLLIRCTVTASNGEGSASQSSGSVVPVAPGVQVAVGGSWLEKPVFAAQGGAWV